MALGSTLREFVDQVGRQVGVKLALKSDNMGYQDDVKKISKRSSKDSSENPWLEVQNTFKVLPVLRANL